MIRKEIIKKINVFVDSREPDDTYLMVSNYFPNTEKAMLEIGDINCGNVYIELKTIMDFVSSIKDGRFRNQLFNLKLTLESNPEMRVYYVIYGNWNKIKKYTSMKPNAIMGAIASIIAHYDIPVVTLPNKEWAIYESCKLIEKSFDHKEVKPQTYKVPTEERAKAMLLVSAERFRRNGVENALEHFGTIKNMVENATIKELVSIEDIGRITAKRFLETINYDFNKKEVIM